MGLTDNAPREKRASKPIFSRRLRCSCNTWRTGRNRIMASVRILMTAKAYQKAALLVQVACLMLLSQEACIGMHCTIVATVEPTVKAETMPRVM